MADCRQLHNLLKEAEFLHELINNDWRWRFSGTKAIIAGDLVRSLHKAVDECEHRQKQKIANPSAYNRENDRHW